MNESQVDYDTIRSNQDVIIKARQKGFSSLGIAYQCVACLGIEGTRAVLISHESSSTQRLLNRAKFYLKYMSVEYETRDVQTGDVLAVNDIPAEVELGRNSRSELYFPKTESTYYIGTAGARAFGRGDTVTDLHISEYGWWESPAYAMVRGLFEAVPEGGIIRIESTGNGKQNDLYYTAKNAAELGFQLYFRGWWQDQEYQREPETTWEPRGFEHYFQDMKTKFNLTEGQLYWYWVKLIRFKHDLNFMKQEYPSTPDECFQATGGALFPSVQKSYHAKWDYTLTEGKRYERLAGHPIKGHTYVIGADPSAGAGNDEAAIQILDMQTLEQVLEYYNKFTNPIDFAHFLIQWGFLYNEAYLVPESNNHGVAVCALLRKEYPLGKIYKEKLPRGKGLPTYGYANSGPTKKANIIDSITLQLGYGLILYGDKTVTELTEFEEDPKTGEMKGPQDGLVIALGLCCIGLNKWSYLLPEQPTTQPKETRKQYPEGYRFQFAALDWMNEAAKRASRQKELQTTWTSTRLH